MSNERLEELAALNAVGLLDDAARTELLAAMDRDPEVGRLVHQYAETAAWLAFETPQVNPPLALKKEIIRQLPPRQGASRLIHFPSWVPYAIAACLMLVGIGMATRIFALKAQLAANRTELTRLSESNAMVGLHLATLDVKDPAYQSSKVIVAWDPFQHRGVIAMQNLPAPAAGYNYQLWVLDPGALSPISAGLIHPEAGSSSFAVQPPSTASPGFAITLEPGQGSSQPTSAILFAVAPGQ